MSNSRNVTVYISQQYTLGCCVADKRLRFHFYIQVYCMPTLIYEVETYVLVSMLSVLLLGQFGLGPGLGVLVFNCCAIRHLSAV